jgi:hypothetical protein
VAAIAGGLLLAGGRSLVDRPDALSGTRAATTPGADADAGPKYSGDRDSGARQGEGPASRYEAFLSASRT